MSIDRPSGILPFDLKQISAEAYRERERILRRFPGGISGIPLTALSNILRGREVLLGEEVRLFLSGIQRNPSNLPSDCVPVALVAKVNNRSVRMVLGLSGALSDRLIDLTLGRDGPPRKSTSFFEERLLSGEKGALLFGLDAAGGDWMVAGGGRFVVKGVLFDGDQIPDYLMERPTWEVTGRLQGPGVKGKLWLWLRSAIPPATTPPLMVDQNVRLWQTAIQVVAGVSRLPLGTLLDLGRGDRILLDGWNHPSGVGGEEVALLVAGKWRRFGRWLDNRRIEVINKGERIADMERSNENVEMPVLLNPSESDDEGEMAVTVTVEVGNFQTTVNQASALVPGRIICMDRAVGPEVALKVKGKLIGRGVLVDHDGLMAVEVKEVLP